MSSHCEKEDEKASLRGTWGGGGKQESKRTRRGEQHHSVPWCSPSCTSWSHAGWAGHHRPQRSCFQKTKFPWLPERCVCSAAPCRSAQTKSSGRKNKFGRNQSITDYANSIVTHSVSHVHHWFGKILRLCCGTTPLHKLQRREKKQQTAIDLLLFSALLIIYYWVTPAYQLMVIHYHQLDVLGFCLDGTLASPHLERATEIHLFEAGVHITFTQDTNHTQHTHTSIREEHLSLRRQQSLKNN